MSAVFDWQLLDAQQVAVASGTLELNNMTPDDHGRGLPSSGSYNWTMSTAGFRRSAVHGHQGGGQDRTPPMRPSTGWSIPCLSPCTRTARTINGQVDRAVPHAPGHSPRQDARGVHRGRISLSGTSASWTSAAGGWPWKVRPAGSMMYPPAFRGLRAQNRAMSAVRFRSWHALNGRYAKGSTPCGACFSFRVPFFQAYGPASSGLSAPHGPVLRNLLTCRLTGGLSCFNGKAGQECCDPFEVPRVAGSILGLNTRVACLSCRWCQTDVPPPGGCDGASPACPPAIFLNSPNMVRLWRQRPAPRMGSRERSEDPLPL